MANIDNKNSSNTRLIGVGGDLKFTRANYCLVGTQERH